jgi:alpha-D-ribose 1-methylphosphonate 5-triphosphate synthase subunit PhnG
MSKEMELPGVPGMHEARMVRSRRTRILVEGDRALRKQLAEQIRTTYRVVTVEEPSWALVMLTVRETARNSLFHPGEVLVSRAKVQVDGILGYGLITGDRLDAAEELALIDAAWNSGSSLREGWIPLLEAEEMRIEEARNRERLAVARTRVEFESMDAEMPS